MDGLGRAMKSTLSHHAAAAPSGPRGVEMLRRIQVREREVARRCRVLLGAAASVAVLAAAAMAFAAVKNLPFTDQASASGIHAENWDRLGFDVPNGWRVADPGAEFEHYMAGEPVQGPFIATVETGPICVRSGTGYSCSRARGIVQRPADGVVAWLSAAPRSAARPGNGDPGPDSAHTACGAGAQAYHRFRLVGPAEDGLAVSLDACVFGSDVRGYQGELDALLVSMRV